MLSILAFKTTPSAQAQGGAQVLISEVSNAGPRGSADEIIELTNYGDAPADLTGWQVYRCAATGSRSYDPQLPPFDGVIVGPGETFLIANAAGTVEADAYYEVSLANDGFGIWLEDGARNLVDAVAVYAAPGDSDCAFSDTPLPNDLNGFRNQTWQRTGFTGVLADDWVKAARTAGEPNATEGDGGPAGGDVLVSELVNGGPAGGSDDFVEFANFGGEQVDVSGWKFYRCWGSGRTDDSSLQATFPAGTVLDPGEAFVAAHTSVSVPSGVGNVRYSVSLANEGFGAMLVDADGTVRDSVGVYEADGFHQPPTGSPCTQGRALPNRLDFGWNQTYQRVGDSGDNAADFVKALRTLGTAGDTVPIEDPEPADNGMRVSELANAGPGGASDEFFELANFGENPVSLAGWRVYRCQEDGRRAPLTQIPEIEDVVLDPGETFVSVHTGSKLFADGDYDAAYSVGLALNGYGVMVLDAEGRPVDAAGVYSAMYSPCTQGLSLFNVLESEYGDSFQRLGATGYNADDFVPAPRSPGSLPEDLRAPTDFTDEELAPVTVDAAPRPLGPSVNGEVLDGPAAELSATAEHTTGEASTIAFTGGAAIDLNPSASKVFTGITDATPPATREIAGEEEAALDGEPIVTETVDGFPFQRFEFKTDDRQWRDFEITWSGTSTGTSELQMYAWNHRAARWDLLDADGGLTGGQITLTGTVAVGSQVRGGRNLDVLIMDGPETQTAFSDDPSEPNLAFKDAAEYDFSLGYVTDTQFLTEGYRDAYAEMSRWIATNTDARGIAYTAHTGDLIQNWLNGNNATERAVDEYEFASDAMGVLDEAGAPYGVTPGNHDTKWGREADLYNQYFPDERYEGQDWYGGAWKEDDAQNHYDVIEADGAKFLFLYLGYYAGEGSIEWANEVIDAHPDHNVVFATHEYLNPDGSLSTPDNYRWTSMADRYWNEIILPNDNVFMVLAGHHHGVALNIKRDVNGVEGRIVVEMMANYQNFTDPNGRFNAGFLRLLQFDLDAGLMAVNTYSPLREEHNAWEYKPADLPYAYDDATDEFVVEVDLNTSYDKRIATDLIAPHAAAEAIGSGSAGDGETIAVAWDDLAYCTSYVWTADAADANGRTARSAAALFDVPGRGGRECD
ncbi:lamin tail domain-containing protein [Glycomyces luteolus]|uniref:Lamin tail domain-containing protein n=1 Tax=Glycomyces luteolus TaxID=2670330 RepID=A0A9X3SSQ3_9ACTN|nr:lamin tail domain-containing protein [Glycomyces luteolus]MDA1362816.1 lamin tail domain-containing protein [Glycomyces luteolus]